MGGARATELASERDAARAALEAARAEAAAHADARRVLEAGRDAERARAELACHTAAADVQRSSVQHLPVGMLPRE